MAKQRGFASHRVSSASPFLLELPRGEMEKIDKSDFHFAAEDLGSDDFSSEVFDSIDSDSFHDGFEDCATSGFKSTGLGASKKRRTVLLSHQDDFPEAEIGEENDFETDTSAGSVSDKLKELKKKLPAMGLRSASMLQTVTTREGTEVDLFEVGSIVRHPDYGIGQVERIDGKGARKMARISFENGKEASFQLNKSSLQLIES
jgi:DNA helicase-2/ATP-dependent DNA helicase PcrA